MDAEEEMDTGEDQAAPVEVDDALRLKEFVAAEPSDGNDKWEVGEQGTVTVRNASVDAELNGEEGTSSIISTGDHPHNEDHDMDIVLVNGSIDSSASDPTFRSVGEETNLTKEASDLGALDGYVMECSQSRDDEFVVVNGVDCMKNEPLEVFEADNEFGLERVENGETEFQNFVSAGVVYEASPAPDAITYTAEGEGLHFQQLLADSEAEDDSNLLQYSRFDMTEAASSSGVSLEAEVGFFYGQVLERGPGKENASHQPSELEEGMHSSQEVEENHHAMDTSDYALEDDDRGPQFEPRIIGDHSQSLACISGSADGPNFGEVGTPPDMLISAVSTNSDQTRDPSVKIASSCTEEEAVVPNAEETADCRFTSQVVFGSAADIPDRVTFRSEGVTETLPTESNVAPTTSLSEGLGDGVRTAGGFREGEADMVANSSYSRDGAEAKDVLERPTEEVGDALGHSDHDARPVLCWNGASLKQLDNEERNTSEEDREQVYRAPETANTSSAAASKPEMNEATSVVIQQSEIAMKDSAVVIESNVQQLIKEAGVDNALVPTGTNPVQNICRQDELIRKTNVESELDGSREHAVTKVGPIVENCRDLTGVEVHGILPKRVQNSDQSSQILDSADGGGRDREVYTHGVMMEVASNSDVKSGDSRDGRNTLLNPKLFEGKLDAEPEARSLSLDERGADSCQRPVDSNGGETWSSPSMGPPGSQHLVAFPEDSKRSYPVGKEEDGRMDPSEGADICEARGEIQPVSKSTEEVWKLQPELPSSVEERNLQSVVNNVKGQVSRPETPAAIQRTAAPQRTKPVIEDKVQTSSQNELQLIIQAGAHDDDARLKGQTGELVSETQQKKVVSESAESLAIRKGRDDVKTKFSLREIVGVPLWIKWRGKWQPGIQCGAADCPPATLKAKPSYSKKHYIVVYSPSARNYSWVDIQHTCPITENPLPLFSGTHESERDTVKDVFIIRRRMLLKLGGEMLDISDRLHVKAVVENARNVNVWKNFASEAAAATTYAELGSLLVNLHLAIVRDFVKPAWMAKRHPLWKEECLRAESAAAVQKLTKELINAVLWDDVGPLWNEPDQPELDPQWSNWKGEAFEEKEEPEDEADTKFAGPSEKEGATVKTVAAGCSKRFKEQARARRQRPQSPEAPEGAPLKRSKHSPRVSDGEIGAGAIIAFRSPLVHPSSGLIENQPVVPALEADRCHEVLTGEILKLEASLNGQIVVSNNEAAVTQPTDGGEHPLPLASSSVNYQSEESENDESKVFERIGRSAAASMAEGLIALESGLCSAYLKNKGRRCHRSAKKEGVKYCEKHLYLIDPESAGKKGYSEGSVAWQSGLCSAFLRRENRRCARQAKEGFHGYCGFHVHLATESKERNGEVADGLTGERGVVGNLTSSSVKDDRCQGITTRGVQCTHRTKDGSLFCVKHSVKGAGQVVERDEGRCQSSGVSKMDWQTATEPTVSLATPVVAALQDAHHDVGFESGTHEGTVRTIELKSFENSRGGEGSTRKRKALSSFFTDRVAGDPGTSAPPSQEAMSPKFTDVKAVTWTQCKGRTTRNEEQCTFRAREGQEYCAKHMHSVEAKKKMNFQRSLRRDEVSNSETKGLGARNILHRFIKSVGGVCSQSSGSDAWNQLVQSTRLEAAMEGTAEELVKLVTVEMTKLQTFLHPLNAGEAKKADADVGVGLVGSSSHSLPKVSETSEERLAPTVRPNLQANRHKMVDDRPVTCGLCDAVVPGVPDLGRHWQHVHKKEVGLFVKGHACRVCDRLYTRKQTVMTHWKKRHQTIDMINPDLSVCFACDVRYADDDFLLEHVIVMHPYQLSNPSLKEMIAENRAIIGTEQESTVALKCPDCTEEFDTQLGLHHHGEKVHRGSNNEGIGVAVSNRGDRKPGDKAEAAPQNGKYVCRLCGMTFPMLPDLGRHHQAAHMLGKAGPARGNAPIEKEVAFECGRMKLPIRRKGDDKAGAAGSSYGPTRRKKKKLRFTSQKKSYEKDSSGPNSLRFHVQAVLQGATIRRRHRKLSEDLSTEPAGKDPSLSIHADSRESPLNDGMQPLASTGSTSLSLTRRVESNFGSVHEKFKLQADKIFTNFSQLHGEGSIKRESRIDGHSGPNDSEKPWHTNKGSLKQDHDVEGSKEMKLEISRSPSNAYTCSEDQMNVLGKQQPNFIVTCEDLSGGQEPVPIVCVIDHDVLMQLRTLSNKESGAKDVYQPSSFTYITKRRLDPSLGLVPENYKIGCTCDRAQCTPDACEHVNLFDCDNAEACDIYGNPMRGRFPYDAQGCIILEEGYLVYECNSSCQCHQTCQNRVLQKGVTVKLEVFKTQYKGWAVRAAEKITRGTFVCEYVGEVLHDQEANKRGERYDQVGCSYLYDIDAHIDITGTGRRSKPFVIDATSQGNVARFINHSCAPNLVNYQVLVESMDAQLAHIGLFASRDIQIGEELAYDYRYRLLPGKGCACHCGAKNCRGRLY